MMMTQFSKLLQWFRKQSLLEQFVVIVFLAGFVIYGGTKSPANNPPPRMSAPRPTMLSQGSHVVTDEEIEQGYRIVEATEGGVLQMPSGTVTNESLRLCGGHEDWFRVEPDGWSFPFRDEVINGVTVLAWGEVRPSPRIRVWPRVMTNDVSFLPEARWNLMQNDGASVFSHAVTTNGSLILDWHNALVGRDINSPTNMQMELCADGSFVWRTDCLTKSYEPVYSFDWDNDGLENSIDPEPRVPHSADCHGTPAEWYATACATVFTRCGEDASAHFVTDDDEAVYFRENVNPNAYYFVNVEIEAGVAPVYFMTNKTSRLGAPVVIARAGEPCRVPLTIGVSYTVTSPAAFSVSAEYEDEDYIEIVTSDVNDCNVLWPIDFEVTTSEGGGTHLVTVVPYDPGGEFVWSRSGSGHNSGGAMLLSAEPQACEFSANDGNVVFGCSSSCDCGGCNVSGNYCLEDCNFPLPSVWCGCDPSEHQDDPEPEPTPCPHVYRPTVTAEFTEKIVLFEDAYTNAPGEVIQKQSTSTMLKITAYGGLKGGVLNVDGGSIGRTLERISGPALPTGSVRIPKNSSVEYTIGYEGKSASSVMDDIKVNVTLTALNDVSPKPVTVKTTSVQLALEAESSFPTNRARHVFGPLEKTRIKIKPIGAQSKIGITGTLPIWWERNDKVVTVGKEAGNATLTAETDSGSISIPFQVIEPTSLEFDSKKRLSDSSWDIARLDEIGYYQLGVAALMSARMLPLYVSFHNLSILEGIAEATSVYGVFAKMEMFPPGSLDHNTEAGGNEVFHVRGTPVLTGNLIKDDIVAYSYPYSAPDEPPFIPGGFTLNIPWAWYAGDNGEIREWIIVPQIISLDASGRMSISKYGHVISRRWKSEGSWLD